MPGSCHPAGSGEVPGVILRASQSRVAATRNDHAGNRGAGRDLEKRTHARTRASAREPPFNLASIPPGERTGRTGQP